MATVPAEAGIGLLDPLIQTPVAVFDLLSAAHANTLIFSVFACLAALELFRSSTGIVLYFARFAFAVAVLAIIATVQYGDFLAAPAKAALSVIMAMIFLKEKVSPGQWVGLIMIVGAVATMSMSQG